MSIKKSLRFTSSSLCLHFTDNLQDTKHRINFVQPVFDLLWLNLTLQISMLPRLRHTPQTCRCSYVRQFRDTRQRPFLSADQHSIPVCHKKKKKKLKLAARHQREFQSHSLLKGADTQVGPNPSVYRGEYLVLVMMLVGRRWSEF